MRTVGNAETHAEVIQMKLHCALMLGLYPVQQCEPMIQISLFCPRSSEQETTRAVQEFFSPRIIGPNIQIDVWIENFARADAFQIKVLNGWSIVPWVS